jgi:hypothetical protein
MLFIFILTSFYFCAVVRKDGSAFGVIYDTTWRLHLDATNPKVLRAATNTDRLENSEGAPKFAAPFSVIIFEVAHPRYLRSVFFKLAPCIFYYK